MVYCEAAVQSAVYKLDSAEEAQVEPQELFKWCYSIQMFLPVLTFLSGLNLVESFPYETVQRDYDYVRLASITAGKSTDLH